MRHIESDPLGSPLHLETSAEQRLREENETLRRQLQELKSNGNGPGHGGGPAHMWRPSRLTILAIVLAATLVVTAAFLVGYARVRGQRALIVNEASDEQHAVTRVDVEQATRSTRDSDVQLPGNIQAITEAPLLARADGYVIKRMADIGDRVKAGQDLAEIDAPELADQVRQGKASLQQAQAALDQAQANLQQGKTDLDLARVTAERWANLSARGVVSKQENDQYQSQMKSRAAAVEALEKAVVVQRNNVKAAEANVSRLETMLGYRMVKAPFDGVITLRNVDSGALVNAGSTLLFRVAQIGTMRIYVNVPQTLANSVKPGQPAQVSVANLPGRHFQGTIARTANSLDPASRTLLLEVHVANPDGSLFPGMYAQVDLKSVRVDPPLLISSTALVLLSEGTKVAVVRPDNTVHLQGVSVGRDYGDRLEITGGLHDGDTVILNPGDSAREGAKVVPVRAGAK